VTEIVEGSLLFTFANEWRAEKYDEPGGFVDRHCHIEGTKRIDIMALGPDRMLLIEVKDFRNHAIQNRERMNLRSPTSLHIEVAQKVRDSFAFLIAAHRQGDDSLRPFYAYAFGDRRRAIDVILFLEEDEGRARSVRGSRSRTTLRQGIQTLLRPFGVRCNILRRSSMPENSSWTVRGARAG
jgi:hypothetical protein